MSLSLFRPLLPLLALMLLAGCSRGPQTGTWYSGVLEADESRIVSQASGHLLEVQVQEGDALFPGQVVAMLDPAEATLQMRQAEAAVVSLQAQLADLQAGTRGEQIRQAEANLQAADAAHSGAEQDLAHARANLNRISQLFAAAATSQQQLDQAQALADAAESRLRQASAQYEAARSQLNLLSQGATANSVNSLSASVRQAEAARDLARLRVERTTVRAVTSGTVLSVNVNPGELVNPNTSLLTVADLSRLWIKLYIPETRLNLARLGQHVRFKVDSYPGKTFPGKVVHIASQAEFTPKNVQTGEERADTVFAVKVTVLDGLGDLKPGMPADVRLDSTEK